MDWHWRPGSIDRTNGMITFSSNLHFHQFPLERLLSEKLCKKVIIENDAKAAAYGEFLAGALKNANNALAITLGTGVGCGIIINKQIYRGSNASSGEMGHMVIEHNGRPCKCGRNGCWEQYASANGLKQTTREMIENQPEHAAYLLELIGHDLNNISGRTSFQAMRDGDMLGTKICNAYIEMLGCGLINAVNIFQPDIVCLGGGVCNEGEALLEPLRKLIEKERYPVEQSHPFTLCKAQLGNDAGIIGAALLGLETYDK
ncbi:MAG: ROK family protein [Acutalibacteraceae bacterium]